MKLKRIAALCAAIAIAAAAAGCSKSAKETVQATAEPAATAEPTPEPEKPAVNPLTGEDGDYRNIRPVSVALRTLTGSAPQWGISSADVLIEGVTEGTTASLAVVYSNVDNIGKVGPVGPGRDLMLQITLPLNAVPVHINKNIYASNLLNLMTYQDIDGLHIGTAGFDFDSDRYANGYREENCWYTTAGLLHSAFERYEKNFEGQNTPIFSFGERSEPENRNAAELAITFSSSDTETLRYNADRQQYMKFNADGSDTVDADNGEQAAFTNVLVLYASSGIKDDHYTREYDLASGGTGLYLTHGAWEEIRWSKGDAAAPLMLTDVNGGTLTVNKGKTFIAVWGGYYGQALRITAEDGSEQTLPEKPALLESGIPDADAEAAEIEFRNQQILVDLREVQAQARLDIGLAYDELEEADPNDADAVAAINARIVELQAIIDQTQAKIDAIESGTPAQEVVGQNEEAAPAEEPQEQPAEQPAGEVQG